MLPHEKVYYRLAPTSHGIGCVAIMEIPQGTNLTEADEGIEMVDIPQDEVESLPEGLKKLYHDFAPLNNGFYTAPKNFMGITPSWFFNHSDSPNCTIDKDYNFWTARIIKEGEELTVDYSTYSDIPPGEEV